MTFVKSVIKAILAHLYIAWIHPFGDGNGRTARLVEFLILESSGCVPDPAAHLISNHYNRTRERYYRELERASATANPTPFIEYAVEGFVDGLREQIERVQMQQLEVTWENFVHTSFGGPETPTHRRRKRLLLDMPPQWIERGDLRRVSPRVAEAYATKGDRTLSRDINALTDMKLLRRRFAKRDGRMVSLYRPNRTRILAFLPLMADPDQLQETEPELPLEPDE
jgi:hypothetical protein